MKQFVQFRREGKLCRKPQQTNRRSGERRPHSPGRYFPSFSVGEVSLLIFGEAKGDFISQGAFSK